MDEPNITKRGIIWCEPDQLELAEVLCKTAALEPIAVGSPDGSISSAMAESIGAHHITDLRQATLDYEHDLVVLMTMNQIKPDEVGSVIGRDSPVVTLEPVPAGIGDGSQKRKDENVRLIPLMRRGRAMRLFREIQDSFQTVRSVSVNMRGNPSHGSLYARLTDAMDAVERVCGGIELLDAAMSTSSKLSADAPNSLRDLHGHITINARFTENCCACVQVSDAGGRWARGMTILGDGGSVRLTDSAFEWWDHDGKLVDSARFDLTADGQKTESDPASFVTLIADQIKRQLDPHLPDLEQRDTNRIIAVCEAVRLSLTTGTSETPRKLHQLIQK